MMLTGDSPRSNSTEKGREEEIEKAAEKGKEDC